MKKIINKITMSIITIVFVAGCAGPSGTTKLDGMGSIIDFVPIIEPTAKQENDGIVNRYVNLTNMIATDLPHELFKNENINSIIGSRKAIGTYQYYSDRMVIGCESCGGRSYVAKMIEGEVSIQKINKNIIHFDEQDKTYLTQAVSEPRYEIMDETLTAIVDTIPLPTDLTTLAEGDVYLYDKTHAYYFGSHEGKKFVLMQYKPETKSWEVVRQVLDYGDEIQGFGDMSYNARYADWVSINVDQLYDARNEQVMTLNKTYFVNTTTGEIKEHELLSYRAPFFATDNMKYSIAVDRDEILVIDPNPDNPQVIDTYVIEEMNKEGEMRINGVLQYIEGEKIIMFVPDGYVQYDIKANKGQYIFEFKPIW